MADEKLKGKPLPGKDPLPAEETASAAQAAASDTTSAAQAIQVVSGAPNSVPASGSAAAPVAPQSVVHGKEAPSPAVPVDKPPMRPAATRSTGKTVYQREGANETGSVDAVGGGKTSADMAAAATGRANTAPDNEPAKAPTPPKPPKPPKSAEQLAYEKARNEHFRATVWQPILRPIVALVSICLVASLLLGLTNELTAPIIQQNTLLEAERARQQLLPEADSFELVDIPENVANVTAIYRAANGAGWVIEAYGRGYGGRVPATVAFGPQGGIVGVVFPANNETVGLGQKVTEPAFAGQFAGRPGTPLTLSDIDAITSATVSSGAAVNAVNNAIEAYNVVTGRGGTAMTPEEVRESLLPGEQLTSIGIYGDNVQPIAWRSDAGNYIIYGEKPSEREGSDSVVIAAVAMDENGVILGLWIDTSGESEAYGALLPYNAEFMNSFIGLSAPVSVDVVAGVTNSSRSVMEAVNNALAALPAAKEAA